jgi:hypothetical protein
MADVLEEMENPPATTLDLVRGRAEGTFKDYLGDRANRAKISYKFERAGYISVRNPDAEDGYWIVMGIRQAIYAKTTLSFQDQLAAAKELKKNVCSERKPSEKKPSEKKSYAKLVTGEE